MKMVSLKGLARAALTAVVILTVFVLADFQSLSRQGRIFQTADRIVLEGTLIDRDLNSPAIISVVVTSKEVIASISSILFSPEYVRSYRESYLGLFGSFSLLEHGTLDVYVDGNRRSRIGFSSGTLVIGFLNHFHTDADITGDLLRLLRMKGLYSPAGSTQPSDVPSVY
jgi:hypothetical protein